MKNRFRMSRRTAGWLLAIFAAFIVVHYAYRNAPTALTRAVTGSPALQVSLRGEVTKVSPNGMTITLEDSHGALTHLTRKVTVNSSTRYLSPGQPTVVGSTGEHYVKQGYRVLIRGQGNADNSVVAQIVAVTFPPITGTISKVNHDILTVDVPGQSQPAHVTLTSHTAFFVPHGQWGRLSKGAPVRVWVVPNKSTGSGLTAVTVMVITPPATGS